MQGPLPLDGLLGAEMTSFLKIENVLKSSFGVSVKVHISHQKKFCKDTGGPRLVRFHLVRFPVEYDLKSY